MEDHYQAGGIGEAVAAALSDQPAQVYILAVQKMPKSVSLEELLQFQGISKDGIVKKVKEIMGITGKTNEVDIEVCAKAPEWAEHQRLSDLDQPCDDGRSGKV